MGRKAGNKLVHGIGINEGTFSTKTGNSNCKTYQLWVGLLERCTKKMWAKYPTYDGVTCSDNFKHYTFFHEWCQSQIGFNYVDDGGGSWHLDKDILIKGNKHYSEDTCVFIPQRLNKLLIKRDKHRGDCPLGVFFDNSLLKFRARCSDVNGKQKHLGSFTTPEQAFQAYKTFKEALIKQVAEQYKSQIDHRAYQALLEYEVNIDD